MKASTKTKQPEWAMESAVRIRIRAMSYPCQMREWDEYIAEIIASTPAIKELVDAAELQVQNFKRQNLRPDINNNLGDDDHEAWNALVSALEPFKEGE